MTRGDAAAEVERGGYEGEVDRLGKAVVVDYVEVINASVAFDGIDLRRYKGARKAEVKAALIDARAAANIAYNELLNLLTEPGS